MITEIGITAGDIWQILDTEKSADLKGLMKEIDAPRDRILMSLGWLAREGHVVLKGSGNDYSIDLVRK